jgi:hypothetical protein
MLKGSWIHQKEIVNYYKYSLIPSKPEYMVIFGDKYEEFYNEALLNQEQPSLTGFIKYYRKFINRDDEYSFEYIIKRIK